MLHWNSTKVRIEDLTEYQHNPRKISKKDFDQLVRLIKEDGYHQRIIVNQDKMIIGGHQRKKALLKAGFKPGDEIEVLMPDRQLTEEEFDKINVRDNLNFGDFDFDILSSRFDIDELLDFGIPEEVLLGGEEEAKPQIDEKEKCTCECVCGRGR